jgi:hypothetical protein
MANILSSTKIGENTLGISVNSLENRISNGGFVSDAYFDSLLETYGEHWVERFIYGSFDDFKGGLFEGFSGGLVDYSNASVHVIDDFPNTKALVMCLCPLTSAEIALGQLFLCISTNRAIS